MSDIYNANYSKRQIGDNYRPEFKKAGWLVNFRPIPEIGFSSAKWFETEAEADCFIVNHILEIN